MSFVKSGYLLKEGSGQGLFQKKNWKRRYFELTSSTLRYSVLEQDAKARGQINLDGLSGKAIETLAPETGADASLPTSQWRFVVATHDRRLVIATSSEQEMRDWVDALLRVLHQEPRFDTTPRSRPTLSQNELHKYPFAKPAAYGSLPIVKLALTKIDVAA
ncbi:hypothetical protein SDRG_15784 [Saprolegnia diclina VS20]|uniref:PH domain-containing protein n=1 Tax=Saprolegnia diclina (strain VS20) TaxID=1156394 RepID=T0R2X0_SAPDV|nr:hypothetical protein SDRG_15784 [Saprolegnia diclina VS20]EQC26373.1 hypothetical protein SDRG_15784 [Saprolegnia diclina VS20]|eukprot:XP_008620188.1 hypothetical protein SDRG_15784 [Saprolegnia diclina VS20]